ncbi:MAG TPA: type II toxin-antitoxin system VapC family toxin [Verrucomicrobiae bacterium]|jgi:predicted nucleic acid-binding protein
MDQRGTALSASFIVDASVGFAWVYQGQATPETDELLSQIDGGSRVVVPPLWFLEMANILMVAQRRRRLTSMERRAALEKLADMQFSVDEEGTRNAFGNISELAEKHGLTIYDATYLELALRLSLPLASRDQTLRNAAKRCGVKPL